MDDKAYPEFIGVVAFKDGTYEVNTDLAFVAPSEPYIRLDVHQSKLKDIHAAVSADAVNARRVSENISFAIRHKVSENSVRQTFEAPLTKTHDQIMGEIVLTHLSVLLIDVATPIIQAYGDARELNGARKGLAYAYFKRNGVWPSDDVHNHDAIRALSPETVCKGE